jgi:L-rhamnose isomerase
MKRSPTEATLKAAYEAAKERYADWGVDPDEALKTLATLSLSLPCWQGDDVVGFEKKSTALSGGILVTGGAPGRARNGDELRTDLDFSLSLLPGKHRVNLHAMYLESEKAIDRDAVEPRHFDRWVAWAKEKKLGLDFNPTYFAHPKALSGLTLSHPDRSIRDFWIEHGLACRRVAADLGRRTGSACVHNTWIPDGYKDAPVDRWAARHLLLESLDRIHKTPADPAVEIDAVESKLFGIGVESATVGSHEFYLGYAVQRRLAVCLDMGHFHPTEDVADKLSAVLLFAPSVLLHLSRPVRWDSDHVVVQDDPVLRVAEELVRIGDWDRVSLGLDYFDATLNRPAAWVIGARAVLRSLLMAMLQPTAQLQELERTGDCTAKLVLVEELKAAPWQAVWDWHCYRNGVPVGASWYESVKEYAKTTLATRN